MAETECAHCWRLIENRGTPSMDGNHSVHWVHVPGGFTVCFPHRGADSPRAEPAAGEPVPSRPAYKPGSPSEEQLLHLVDRAESGTLLAAEAVQLRDGVRALVSELAQARRTVGGLTAQAQRLRRQLGVARPSGGLSAPVSDAPAESGELGVEDAPGRSDAASTPSGSQGGRARNPQTTA